MRRSHAAAVIVSCLALAATSARLYFSPTTRTHIAPFTARRLPSKTKESKCDELVAGCSNVQDDMWSPWRMTSAEKAAFEAALRANGKEFRYVEFGSGGSTTFSLCVAKELDGQVCSFEMAPDWHAKMQGEQFLSCPQVADRLNYFAVDSGVGLGGWSYLKNGADVKKASFDHFVFAFSRHSCSQPQYTIIRETDPIEEAMLPAVQYALSEERTIQSPVNSFVPSALLVDGRFRVAITLAMAPYLDDSSIVMVHDWTNRISAYRVLLKYFDVLAFRNGQLERAPEISEALRALLSVRRATDTMTEAQLQTFVLERGITINSNSSRDKNSKLKEWKGRFAAGHPLYLLRQTEKSTDDVVKALLKSIGIDTLLMMIRSHDFHTMRRELLLDTLLYRLDQS
ncbi:MAG: uncharacterized protein KVP18_000276 [Porospora cf. gigantea A]|uniref:uncharacterized protein n=1 Tax=Porospora cf. gigantea A TaxID=2853593 RepID=UPI00355ABBD6|nr:MAG: hypothetical protein KVP18_000276 [Porospora cf. gigantea A]